MSASVVALILEVFPLVFLAYVTHRLLLRARFHNTKYLTEQRVEPRKFKV